MRRSAFHPHLAAAARGAIIAITFAVVCACGAEVEAQAPAESAPAAGAAAPGGACGKDTDCKGDRICDHGSCVAPH
jgi:hypothetical protein